METTTLTEGAIMKICRDEYPKGENWKPVLQILDVRMVNTQGGQPVAPEKERYRVVISDGAYHQQGMLGTQNNDMVRQGRLQKGSLVRLKEFVCTPVQARLIIIIVDLDLIVERCDLIGEPEPAPKFVNTPPSGAVTGNPQSSVGNKPSGGQVNETVPATSVEQPRMNQSFGSAYSTNPNSGRYAPSIYPKAEPGAGFPRSAPVGGSYSNQNMGSNNPRSEVSPSTPSIYPKAEPVAGFPRPAPVGGSYSNQNMGFNNPRSEVSRLPQNSHARAPYPSYQQPPPMYSNRGPVAKNEAPARILPIAALNPYQGRWTIKARVTSKGELRHFNNPRGDGKVFSFDLLDSEGGEIRVTCFNTVADQFYNQIEVGKIYMISRGSLKPAQKAFNHLHNDHEIFLESTSIVQPCYEDDNSIPRQQFHFHPISDVQEMDNNSVVDLIGVVSFINPASSIMRKNGTETQKRSLHLKDMSGRSVELTLWGNFCNAEGQRLQNMCDSGVFPVLAVKSGRVNDFNGKAVGTISSSQLFINPDFPEAHRLKEWFDKEGRNAPSVSISREISTLGRTDMRKTISQIKDEKLGTSEKPDWITVGATISFIKVDNFCYTACPLMIGDRQCNKKVTNNGDGKWRCDRCDQSIEECDYRYILQLQIQDHTGLTWVTAFQEGGEEVMGVSAKSLYYLKHEEQDDEKFAQIVRKVLFNKFIFKLKIKEETFSDEQRVKSTVVKAERVNFSSESKFLLDLMDNLKAGNSSSSIPKVENIIPNPGLNASAPRNVGSRQTTPADFGNSTNAVREFGTPANQVGQYGNRYSSSGFPSTGSSGMYLSCNSCGGTGHSSMNCPSIANSPGLSSGGGYANRPSSGPSFGNSSDECYKCHQSGHWARDCPGSSNIPPSYGSGSVVAGRFGGVPKQQVGGF